MAIQPGTSIQGLSLCGFNKLGSGLPRRFAPSEDQQFLNKNVGISSCLATKWPGELAMTGGNIYFYFSMHYNRTFNIKIICPGGYCIMREKDPNVFFKWNVKWDKKDNIFFNLDGSSAKKENDFNVFIDLLAPYTTTTGDDCALKLVSETSQEVQNFFDENEKDTATTRSFNEQKEAVKRYNLFAKTYHKDQGRSITDIIKDYFPSLENYYTPALNLGKIFHLSDTDEAHNQSRDDLIHHLKNNENEAEYSQILQFAVHSGNLEALDILFSSQLLEERSLSYFFHMASLNFIAIENHDLQTLEYLLTKQIEACNPLQTPAGEIINGLTPLRLAAKKGYLDIVKCLVDFAGVKETDIPMYPKTSFVLAIIEGHYDVFIYLLENGVRLTKKYSDISDRSLLHLAVVGGNVDIVKMLIALEIQKKIDKRDLYEKTPLHLAAEMGHVEIVQCLIENGANVNALDDENLTPLQLAEQHNHEQIVELLKAYSTNFSLQS